LLLPLFSSKLAFFMTILLVHNNIAIFPKKKFCHFLEDNNLSGTCLVLAMQR